MTESRRWRVHCAWVPGTTDRVRFRVAGLWQPRELRLTVLVRLLGRRVADELYLRGRSDLRPQDWQQVRAALA